MKRRSHISALAILAAILALTAVMPGLAQRRITPVQAPSAQRQPVDSALIRERALEARRARSIHYHDANGRSYFVDTLTNTEWVDSTLLPKTPKMVYPMIHEVDLGLNIFDPLMRAFGQKYGGADISASLSMYNRFFPTIEFGMGAASNTPSGNNFTYRSPLSPYFKIGIDYNFLYNSDPTYRFFAGVRYGISFFKFSVEDVTLPPDYWQESVTMGIPSASVTAGWFEIVLGLRVKLWRELSAGWQVKYHTMLHRTRPPTGDAWYIPGFGTAGSALTAGFSFYYSFSINKKKAPDITDAEAIPAAAKP